MGDAEVRNALVTYLTGQAIPHITKWYDDEPWIIQGNAWQPVGGVGALAYVHIDDVQDTRLTLPVEAGNKKVAYAVSLLIMYRYQIPSTVTPGTEDQWVGPLDTIIGATKTAIRRDPNAGSPAVIWQWGQSANGIRHTRDLPTKNRGYVQSWNRIVVDVTEIITA